MCPAVVVHLSLQCVVSSVHVVADSSQLGSILSERLSNSCLTGSDSILELSGRFLRELSLIESGLQLLLSSGVSLSLACSFSKSVTGSLNSSVGQLVRVLLSIQCVLILGWDQLLVRRGLSEHIRQHLTVVVLVSLLETRNELVNHVRYISSCNSGVNRCRELLKESLSLSDVKLHNLLSVWISQSRSLIFLNLDSVVQTSDVVSPASCPHGKVESGDTVSQFRWVSAVGVIESLSCIDSGLQVVLRLLIGQVGLQVSSVVHLGLQLSAYSSSLSNSVAVSNNELTEVTVCCSDSVRNLVLNLVVVEYSWVSCVSLILSINLVSVVDNLLDSLLIESYHVFLIEIVLAAVGNGLQCSKVIVNMSLVQFVNNLRQCLCINLVE